MTNNQAIGIVTEAHIIEIMGVIEVVFTAAEIADHVAKIVSKIKTLIKTKMIQKIKMNLLKNVLYLYPISSSDL